LLVPKSGGTWSIGGKIAKMKSLRVPDLIFQQNRYDPDRFLQATWFPAQWVIQAPASCPMGFAVCPV
jgi:hypothetical protein